MMIGFPMAILLDSLFELFIEVLAFLWRILLGFFRFVFRFDFIVELVVEIWCSLGCGSKKKQKSPPPEE